MVQSLANFEEKAIFLFQPDTLAPEQFLKDVPHESFLGAETKLMLAILEDAIACFQDYFLARDRKGRALFRSAANWIFAEPSDWLFSFDNISEALGLSPDYLRNGLLSWMEVKLSAHSKTSHNISATFRAGRKRSSGIFLS
ncbi:MAG: hypothetical protein HY695_09955 [Deltaproteobacteria bacterium]|nr:hypothetical protein [Deltaproteobacteria bacterium]